MKKSLVLVTVAIAVFSSSVLAQDRFGVWRTTTEDRIAHKGERRLLPRKQRIVKLDRAALRETLSRTPKEHDANKGMREVWFEVPMPDRKTARFKIERTSVLADHLEKAFPDWHTFRGTAEDGSTGQFDWTSKGFHGYVFTANGTVYIDPYQENDTENYIVYFRHEYGTPPSENFSCNVGSGLFWLDDMRSFELDARSLRPSYSIGANIRTYRIAIATTGEWARGTTTSTDPVAIRTSALAAITTSINRLDGIFRHELSVSLQLVNPPIDNAGANVIFDDPATDPYDNTDSTAQLTLNHNTLMSRLGASNFDLGHLFGTGGGGVASSPSVCSDTGKGEGYSARAGFYGDPFTVDYVAHEVGHQFGASHSYNNADPSGACTTRSAENAFEVGSGSTIMSYVGICNERNLQQYVDIGIPSFHIRSLTEMTGYLQDAGGGGSCGVPSGSNNIPTVDAGQAYTIPKLTPFTLTATGNDGDAADVPNLRYSWEEYDLAPSASGALGTPAGTYDIDTDGVLRPLFRAYSPVSSPSRTFPSLPFIISPATNDPAGSNNPGLTYTGTHPSGAPGAVCEASVTCVTGERLPSVARTMNFRVSVRDRRGGIADAGTTVTVVNTAGPFQITSQNTAGQLAAGSTATVTWDVVGTDAAPINAANVKISLSIDGGQTFPTILSASTANDGSEAVTVPNIATTAARIKVEAIGNIFFDISNANLEITGGAAAASVGDATGGEGNPPARGAKRTSSPSNDMVFTISLSAPSDQPVTVRVSTNSLSATEGTDFTAVDNFDVVFPAGTTTRDVIVPLIADPGDEPDEEFTLDIVSIAGNAVVSDGQGIGTITDDDAAIAELSGRVVSSSGRALGRVTVRLIDSENNVQTTLTSPFGYFVFVAVETGRTYTVAPRSRRYQFPQRIVQVLDSVANVDFTPLE